MPIGRGEHVVPVAGLGDHVAGRADHHRVAGVARAGLADPDDVHGVLDRARRSSVRQWSTLPRPATQAAGTTSSFGAALDQLAGELGEAQVVAGHQPDAEPADVDEHRLDGPRG